MGRISRAVLLMAAGLYTGAMTPALAQSLASTPITSTQAAVRERISIDRDWHFAFGHATDAAKDFGYGTRPFFFAKAGYGDGPAGVRFDDRAWRKLDLPHDWAVELPFDARGDTNHGSKAIGRNFPENSIGWYRKTIDLGHADEGRRISLTFDGVYRDSVVWFNGHYIGREPSGYSSFSYDVTDYVNYDGPNVIAVRVDATGEEGWFYEGAGIYRHVWLTKTAPVHVAQWGTFVSSEMTGDEADLTARVTVENNSRQSQSVIIEQKVYDPKGVLVAAQTTSPSSVGADGKADISTHIAVKAPTLWSLENPALYKMVTVVRSNDAVVDTYETPFGIRTIKFDPDKGFFLNGKRVELKGIDNHQDFAGVGVGAPDALLTWRLKRLKEIGVNAVRMSHNPPAPELLDAADRLGFLVIDEHRMMGTTPEIRGQLERMVRRDRNHPSVILWSVGNEEWALEWTPLGTRIADDMQWIVKQLDPTRRTTLAASGSGQGTSVAADVIGFNYRTQHDIDGFHKKYPDKPAVVTEEGATNATRGVYFDDRAHVHLAAYDREGRPGSSSSIEEGWRFAAARPFIGGMFVWTGFDYRGETTPFGWPAISSQFGMLDTTGVIKDSGYYLKSVWTDKPMVHLLPNWNLKGHEGQAIDVWAYANTEAVELFLDGKSLGRKTMTPLSHLSWSVPYHAGTLSAKGYTGGKVVAMAEVATTGDPKAVQLSADRAQISADGADVAVITVTSADAGGRLVPDADNLVTFEVQGPIRIIGVGNGDPGSHEADRVADRYDYFSLANWHSKAVDGVADRPETAVNADMSSWRNPFQWIPASEEPPATKALVIRGEFTRPAIEKGETIRLFVANLGAGQSVYLNGKPVTLHARDGGYALDIDPADLSDKNSVSFVLETPAGGITGLADASQGGVNWATLRVTRPAANWQRSLFSGYAQVIVQSTGEPGRGTLIARSHGLKEARISVNPD